jgi:hypothetical protein
MITSLYVSGVSDAYASTLELDTLIYPLFKFGWTPELEASQFPKTNSYGSWKTRSKVNEMTIEMNGAILADTTSDFWTRRKALMAKIIPPPTIAGVEMDHVRFIATFDGDATTYYADAILESNIGALEATGAPTIQEFQCMFVSREGYWRDGLAGSAVVI